MEIQFHQTSLEDFFRLLRTSMDDSTIDNEISHLKTVLKVILEKTGDECLKASVELYNLLIDPGCSVEWFSYVLMIIRPTNDYCPKALDYIVKALDVQKPTLQGRWEIVAWIILKWIDHNYIGENYNELNTSIINKWIVQMIGDPNTCPVHSLCYKFLDVFTITQWEDKNLKGDFESFMTACITLKIDQPFVVLYGNDPFEVVQLVKLMVDRYADEEFFPEFDQHLSTILQAQITSIFRDVTYSNALSQNSIRASHELDFVRALFKFTSNCAKQIESFGTRNNTFDLVELLETLLASFTKSCQTPHLLNVTASCIMDVVENVLNKYMMLLVAGHNKQSFNGNVMLMLDGILGQLIGTKVFKVVDSMTQERLFELLIKLITVRFDIRMNALFASWDMAIGLTEKIKQILYIAIDSAEI